MSTAANGKATMNVTETDIAIAEALYPILVECARSEPIRTLTYGDLLATAKSRQQDDHPVQNAIPVSLGRRLDVIRLFIAEQKLPNLTSLIVNAGTGEVGAAFGKNPEEAREQVAAFDWDKVSDQFSLKLAGLKKSAEARARPKLSRAEAKDAMARYYQKNRTQLPHGIERKRDEIIASIMSGATPEDAFQAASS